MKIVIIDDSKSMRDLLTNEISKLGNYKINSYEFGSYFIDDYKKDFKKNISPDIVFLDGTLPNGMFSNEVLKEIMNINPDQFVVMFGGVHLESVPKWLELGAKNFLSKPLEINKLKEILNKLK